MNTNDDLSKDVLDFLNGRKNPHGLNVQWSQRPLNVGEMIHAGRVIRAEKGSLESAVSFCVSRSDGMLDIDDVLGLESSKFSDLIRECFDSIKDLF